MTRGAGRGKPPSPAAEIARILGKKGPNLRGLAGALRTLVRKLVPGVRETINPWGIPAFDYHGPMAYFMVHAGHITFGFQRGVSLADPERLLEGNGKSLRHVKLRTLDDLRRPALKALIKDAARLNRKEPQKRMAQNK